MAERINEQAARQLMIDKGFLPSVAFTRANDPWPGVCLLCGQPGRPRYNGVQQGDGPCGFCAKNKMDDAVVMGIMLSRDFLPSVPYTSATKPWPGVCLVCGNAGRPTFDQVRRGKLACGYCARNRIDDAVATGKMLALGFLAKSPYPGNLKPWLGECANCQTLISPRYSNVQQGQGPCPHCAVSGFSANKPAVFYAVTDGAVIKAGVANNERTRLAAHRRQGLVQVLHVARFTDGTLAVQCEIKWKAYVQSVPEHRITRDHLQDGYTEAVRHHDEALRELRQILGKD